MCDVLDEYALEPLERDEWVLDTPLIRGFVGSVRAAIERSVSPVLACRVVEPSFRELLTRPDWLPMRFQEDSPGSGMGDGIGQWLLFRAADRSLCLFSLVVPPGSRTPVHDHLAWGLVGLYKGNQDEEIYDLSASARCSRAITTRCFLHATMCTAYARPPR
jgi:3-mercaptopropionate dioxygenase